MQTIQGWFQGGPSSKDAEAVSLLEGWKQYEAQSQGRGFPAAAADDLESGGYKGVGDTFAPFFGGASSTFADAWTSVSKSAQDLPGSFHRGATILPSRRAVLYFAATISAGMFFIMLAFTVFLPVMVLAPQKFALCFTLGCLLVMGSFFVLKGPAVQLKHMTSAERLPFTAFFVGSMASTVYSSVVLHSYLLSVCCSGIQILALLYYVVSYFPGGSAGMRFLSSVAGSTVWAVVGR
eukprot:TRINITY_DN32705_c0_g1_i1.p1 TRINITY_DN32705_c0_g1~~TRINITY_DN32705_c0_g1_i1.p1  ORF type:complete len:236 (+),score=50.92 TRINITY_DN32705_c0_g1_i1:801-1508(+)